MMILAGLVYNVLHLHDLHAVGFTRGGVHSLWLATGIHSGLFACFFLFVCLFGIHSGLFVCFFLFVWDSLRFAFITFYIGAKYTWVAPSRSPDVTTAIANRIF